MEKIFMELAKKGFCPDEIRMNANVKVDQIREEYDQKFFQLIRWFWEEVDKQTTTEEKKILFDQISKCLQEEIIKVYNETNK